MSQELRGFLGSLFGSTDSADCCIRFHVASEAPQPQGSCPSFIGTPLPAHQLVLRGGSQRFRAHIERWAPFSEAQGDHGKWRAAEQMAVKLRISVTPDGSAPGSPLVRVELSLLRCGGGSSSGAACDCKRLSAYNIWYQWMVTNS